MDVDDPAESSGAQRAVTTSEPTGEAKMLEEEACIVVDQALEALWHARLGHLNRGDLQPAACAIYLFIYSSGFSRP